MTTRASLVRFAFRVAMSVALAISFSACKKDAGWKSASFEDRKVKPQSGEVQIPASLWERLTPAKKEGEEQKVETALEPLKVFLIEKNKGVLKGQNIALSFVAGGGELNLSDYVQPLRGSFYLAYEFLPDVENAETKVYFVSNAVERKLDGQTVGAGCEKYFDLSKIFAAAMKKDGFLLNTSDQRHVSALSGTYVFASTFDGRLHLASLVIGDSRYRALQCRR